MVNSSLRLTGKLLTIKMRSGCQFKTMRDEERVGATQLNVKPILNISSPIFSKFTSVHLNPLETQGPIIVLRKPSSAGEKPAY